MPSARKAVMQMNEKQRKAAIIVASILGCGALFYLGGLLGQAFTNYTIWLELVCGDRHRLLPQIGIRSYAF